jgi:DNA-binding MarR family transcriptional regulator
VADKFDDVSHEAMTMGAKQYFFAARAFMEDALRPFDLGSVQWYVLGKLVDHGRMDQRELYSLLKVSRATLSDIIIIMVQKGLISQSVHGSDQRQKTIEITTKGKQLWESLPNPAEAIMSIAFQGVPAADLALIRQTLLEAAGRLNNYKKEGDTL